MIDYNSRFGYTPQITFTLEQHLTNYAEIEVNARRLLESFHIIREKMEVNLRPIIALFPHYSEHSHEHSEHIISAIEKLLGRSRIEKLLPADTWMLLVCAYMHDLGMLVQGKELEEDWKTLEFQEHIKQCMNSNDNELKNAALNVVSIKGDRGNPSWPVHIYRDVILLTSEFYRRRHPERARMLPQRTELKQAFNIVMSGDGKIPQRIQETVGKICFSHGISFKEMLELLEPVDSLLGYVFHPRFIAALLCIGDLCDLDNGRFNSMAIETFGGLTRNNLVHYYKHESVTSFVVQKDIISVNFDIRNRKIKEEIKNKLEFVEDEENNFQDFCDSVLLETQNWISWMVDIVENIKLYWNEFGIFDIETLTPTLNYKILVEGKETISSKKNMRFSFSNEKAYELIEGYNLYNNHFVFIRELLQNSIDALKKQFWQDILSGRWDYLLKHLEVDEKIDYTNIQPYDFSDTQVYNYYQVKITVKHNDKDPIAYFIIEDNGTGISKEDVEKRIINTGFHNDSHNNLSNKMPEWLKPTSAFGIGLHSVFAVADTLFVKTRTEFDKTVYNINMHSGKRDGYVFMSIAEDQEIRFCNCNHGTQMKFAVNVSKCSDNEEESKRDFPWKERPESDFCRRLQNMLNSMLHTSLFHVSYKFNLDKEITHKKLYEDKYIGLLFRKNSRNNILGKTYNNKDYDFAIDMDGNIVLWDRKRAISMLYILEVSRYNSCEFLCKGFKVNNTKRRDNKRGDNTYKISPSMIHYWGGDTKDILNVSRDKLSQKQIEYNKVIFLQARNYLAEVYYSLLELLLQDDTIKQWHCDVNKFMENWLLKKVDNVQIPSLSKENVDLLCKYKSICLKNDKIKCLFLKHAFCMLLQSCKKEIQDILNALDEKRKIKYIVEFEIMDVNNEINNIIKEQTYFYEFVTESFEILDDEIEKTYMMSVFKKIFKIEFCNIFINYTKNDLNEIYSDYFYDLQKPFGEIYINGWEENYQRYRKKVRNIYKDYLEIRKQDEFIMTPLEFYLSIPLTRIVFWLICAHKKILPLENELLTKLSYIPGYTNSYGFINVNNVSDIIMSSELIIEKEKYNQRLVEYFPSISFLSCTSIDIKNEKIILQFKDVYENKKGIHFQNNSFSRLLHSLESYEEKILVPVGFEDIAINSMTTLRNSDEMLYCSNNYITYLWDSFGNIKEKYGSKINTEEDKEAIINEIMPTSRTDTKSTIYLLRYIYHNRAYNIDLNFDEAWEKIYDTYKKFVRLVLDCIKV